MTTQSATASEIIQRLYDSELNGRVSWFYAAGFEWSLGDDANGLLSKGHAKTIEDATRQLAEAAVVAFPRSEFAAWWAEIRTH